MDFTRAPRLVPVSLVAGRGHYETVIEAVLAARTSVWIATANLKELMVEEGAGPRRRYRSVLEVFAKLARRGVELRILHAGPPSRAFRREFDRHAVLYGGGLQLAQCPRVHMKVIVVDGGLAYLGSANWTGAGLGAKGAGRRNFEVGVTTGDPELIDEVQALYERVWRGAECRACKLRDVCAAPLDGRG